MKFFDLKFRYNKQKYFFQSLLGGIAVGTALILFDVVNRPVIIASLGASAFIAFTIPKQKISSPRNLIGGYIIGIVIGAILHFLTILPIDHYMTQKIIHILAAIIAVTLAIFIMTITNTEHSPATGIALGLVINDWTLLTIFQIIAAISIISAMRRILKNKLIDLI